MTQCLTIFNNSTTTGVPQIVDNASAVIDLESGKLARSACSKGYTSIMILRIERLPRSPCSAIQPSTVRTPSS